MYFENRAYIGAEFYSPVAIKLVVIPELNDLDGCMNGFSNKVDIVHEGNGFCVPEMNVF